MILGPRRRFWRTATVEAAESGHTVLLDRRPLMTSAKAPLVVPSRQLAEAIAAEWRALGDAVVPDRLPLTRYANSAIDRVAARRDDVARSLAEYGGTDLLCYRAGSPQGLVARQAAAWDPWLAWSAAELSAPLVAVSGVMHHPQAAGSLAALAGETARHDAFGLTALFELVTLSGSLLLGLAISRGALSAETAWELAHIDETWQAEQWGRDAEAEAAFERRREEFLRAEAFLRMLRARG
jgi:chaperone required for assembly of F1-ATPase